jgi:cytochrome c peroxidase
MLINKLKQRSMFFWVAVGFGICSFNAQAEIALTSDEVSKDEFLKEDILDGDFLNAGIDQEVKSSSSYGYKPFGEIYSNASGAMLTFSHQNVDGYIDRNNAFFESLGTNGRSCASCHIASDAWTITPKSVQKIFKNTQGLDPLFSVVDGSNSPLADVSSYRARKEAFSMLLNRAVIRIGMPIPANAEFELIAVDDPYGYASASELSLFRRILPSGNLKFLSAVMWDGRETVPGNSMVNNLFNQAETATRTHAEAMSQLTEEQKSEIVNFELSLFSAQIRDRKAGRLDVKGAEGGPVRLLTQDFFVGINDPFGGNPTGAPFDNRVFTIFNAWDDVAQREARQAIARGQKVFNERTFTITGVSGLNDEFNRPVITTGRCANCHNAPNSGNKSKVPPQDIGISDAARRVTEMPLYTLRNKVTGAVVETTDPGRALVTGLWKDINRFKISPLRALAARPPYFHDGSAPTLESVIDFYETRFNMGLSTQERSDLLAFLNAL